MSEKLMEVNDVAEYLGVSKRTVQRLTKAQKIPYMRLPLGRSIRYDIEQLKRWVRCNTTTESFR